MNPITLKLSSPIKAYGESVSEITLREPTGKDLRACGVPVTTKQEVDGSTSIRLEAEFGALLISRLANIPASSVDHMTAADFMAALGAAVSFFAVTSPDSSSTRTTT